MKRFILALILLFALSIFAAPYNTRIKVLLWDDALTQALKVGLPDFERSTGIKVDLELVPSGTLLQKTLISVTTKSSDYDLIAVDEPNIPMVGPLLTGFSDWPQTQVYTRPSMADIMPLAFAAGSGRESSKVFL